MQRHSSRQYGVVNQTLSNEQIEETILSDETNEITDCFILFALWCALGALILNHTFATELAQTIHGFGLLVAGVAAVIIIRMRDTASIPRKVLDKKIQQSNLQQGTFISLDRSSKPWEDIYWITFKTGKKTSRQYIPKSEYEILKANQEMTDNLVVLKYPRCKMFPVFSTGYRVFDTKTLTNNSNKTIL